MPILRVLSLCGLGGGFLLISPSLRGGVNTAMATLVSSLNQYSPWSYVGAALALFGLLMISMVRASQPH